MFNDIHGMGRLTVSYFEYIKLSGGGGIFMDEEVLTCPKCNSEKVSMVGTRRYLPHFTEQDYKCECGHEFTYKRNREEAKHRGS